LRGEAVAFHDAVDIADTVCPMDSAFLHLFIPCRPFFRSMFMAVAAGFFVDWDGNVRSTLTPGGGYLCETDVSSRYVAITTPNGTLVHEASFYGTLADLDKAGIKASLVAESHPWGNRKDGF
jgi:hypothetical protein